MAKNTCLGISFTSQADKQSNFTKEVSEILNIPEGLLVHGSIIKLAIEGYASYLGTQNNITINPADLLELDKTTKEYKLKEEYKEGFRNYLQNKYTNKSVIIETASDIREEFKKENILRYSIEDSKESANRLSQLITERFGNIVTILPLLDSKFLVYINNVVTAEEYVNNLKQKRELQEIQLEMQQIKAEAIANGTFMKAPNGKPTNLTERQWLQVRTKAFIKWFGDWINDPANASKVVDENGEPLVVYHWSRRPGFNIFEKNKNGIHFTKDKTGEYIYYPNGGKHEYEADYKVFLNIKNPAYEYKSSYYNIHPKNSERAIKTRELHLKYDPLLNATTIDKEYKEINKQYSEELNKIYELYPIERGVYRESLGHEEPAIKQLLLKYPNKDGIISDRTRYGAASAGEYLNPFDFIVFNPNQVKSATDNNGEFSEEDNNILHDIKTDSEYQEMLDELSLSRSKTDDFVYNFVTKILNVNPRYKVKENTDAFAYWFMEGDSVNRSDFASLTKKIFGYMVDLDTDTRGKFNKSVKEALKNWSDNLQQMLQGNSDDKNYLSELYDSLYKAQYNIKLLQRFLNHGLDKSSFTQDEINSIDELLLLPDNEITKQKVGFKLQKIKLGVSTTEQEIQRVRNKIFQLRLAAKNRIVALNVIDNIKDLVEKRLLAEYDSRTVKQETIKEKLLPLQDLYAAILKTIYSKEMKSVGLTLFNKATETLSSYEELQNAVFLMYPQYENLLKLMHKANPELKIYIGGEPQQTPTGVVAGLFDPGTNELHLSNIADIHTIIHEMAHSATYYGIVGLQGEDGVLFKESIGKFMDYIREYIKEKQLQPELFKSINILGIKLPASVYGFTNESEFIAELFGNPEFQELLDLIPAMDEKQFRSILGQIWDTIVKFLNSLMGKNKLNKTALDLARELGSASMFLQQQHLDYIYERLDEYKNHRQLNIVLQKTQQFVPNFNKISDKTVAFGVELNKGGAKTMQSDAKKWQQSNSDGIVAYRKYQDTPKTFTPETVEEGWIGNPFSTETKGKDTVQKFGEWLVTGNNFGEERANEEFRQAIIDKILATSEDAKILYYIELKNRPSHATVIGYLVRNKQLLQQSQPKTQSLKQISISTEGYRKGDPQRNPDTALDDYVEEITRVRNEFARRVVKDKEFKKNHTYWIIDETGKHKANESITTLAHGSQGKGDFTSVLLAKIAFGNIFDAFVRDYFATDGKMIKGKTYPVIGSSSTKMFKALKKEVDKLKESFNKLFGEGKYKVLTKFESINGNDEFTVGGQMDGSYTAGTLDMLIVTDKGEVYIYDMKATMSDDSEFNTRANEEYQGQVELYKRFINANSKLQVKDSLESLGLIVANPYLEINGEKRTYLESMDNPTVNDEGEVLIDGNNNFELYFTIRQNDLGGYVKYFNLLILLKNPKIRTATIKLLFAIPEVKQIVEGILKSGLTQEQKKQQLNEVKNAALAALNALKPLETTKPVVPSFNPRRPVAQSLVLYIGRNMVKLISLYADTIAKNPAMLEKMGYSTLMKSTLEIPEGLTGNQVLKRYFQQLRPFFIKTLTNMYFKERQGDSPMVLALKRWFKGFTNVDGLVRRNLDIVLDRAFGEFMEIEDIKIADATYQTLEDVNYDISNLEEGALIYGFDSREKNYMDSISTLVRRKLATIMQFTYKRNADGTYMIDSDGMPIVDTLEVDGKPFKKQETDPYGFGMPVFKDKFDVVNFMLNMFHSCATSESLMKHIKEEMKNTPWLYEVYKMLVNDKTLQTQMMLSLHRNQTSYASIYSLEYTEPGEDGQSVKKTRYVIKNENSRARTEVLKSSMYRFYLSRLTSDKLKYNNNTQKYRLVLNDSIDSILQNIGNEKDFEKKKSLLISLLSDIGVNTSFINNYDKLLSKKGLNSLIQKGIGKRRTGALRYLLENMANREFDYDTVSAYYTPLFMILQLGMPNQYELSTRIGDKTYMTYSLVSYIEREIQRLAGKDIDVSDDLIFGENSIYRKYRQYNAGGENLFVNSILLEIADNKELRQYLQYYTLPAVDGKPLFKQNGKEYLMQILLGYFGINLENQTSFFFEDSTMKLNVALFRVGTMSDKPTSDFIQWRKEATLDLNSPRGDKGKQKMRDDITEKASRYFWYELSRARSVVELVLNSPDTDVANIHINRKKAKDFIEKIANKQKINRADLYENGKLKSYIEGSGMTFKYIPVLNNAFEYDANADRKNDNIVDSPEFYNLLNKISEDTLGDNSLLTKEHLEILSLAFVTLYLRKLNNENLSEEETKKMQSIFNKLYQYGMSLEFRSFLDAVEAQFQGNYEELQNSIKELTIGNREDFLEEFFYNDSLMAMNIYNILIGDPAYYKDSVDLQKRFAEVHSSSARPDITATVNLNTFADHDSERNNNTEIKLTDGKCRVVIIKDAIEQNEELALTIAEVFGKLEENARKEGRGREADQFKIYKEIIPASLREGIEVTDGQAYSSPTGFWKKLHLLGDINIQRIDSALKSIREGKITSENVDIVILEFKPFIYSRVHKNGNTSLGDELVSLQIKDSEAMIMLAGAIIQGALAGNYIKDNPLVEMFNFMEASHYGKLKEYFEGKYDPKSVSIDDYRPDGIDTIAFLSAVKNGSWAVIDLNGKDSEQMRRELQKTVKMEIGLDRKPTGQLSWNDDFVHPMSFEDWGKQTENPAHMQDHELDIGSQIKMLAVSDLPDNFRVKIKGVEYDKQSFLNRYFKLLEEDYRAGIALVLDDLNIFEKYDKEQNRIITQDEKLADLVKNSILNDSKLNSELLEAFALEEYEENGMKKKRFKYPVGDPSIAPKFFSTVFNVIKDYVNRQKLPGGPIVQVAPYGMSDKLHLVDDNNNVISRETLFDKNGKIVKSIILEVYITPPTLLLLELLTKKDGSLMTIEEAKNKGILKDEDLELIGYRIPTEDKYSMYRMKIKGFLPREMGELIIMPREITWLSGSDYDIDKIFTMFRNHIYKKERNNKKLEEKTRMNDIFDMQWAALQHPSSVEKQLNHGDFSELGDLAKLISGSKRIGSTMYVQNQMRFHTENAAGKEFVGIAALNNVSHVISNFANIHFKEQFGFNFQILMRPKNDELAPIRFDLSTFADDTQKVRIDPAYSPADGSRLSRNIGMYVGASADNAKNALLGKLNTRPITATIAMGMLRLGFPVSTVSYMLSMPKIVELSNEALLKGKRIENLIHLEALQLDESLVTGNESILSELEMLDFTTGKNQESSIQDAVIVFLDLISPYCKAISDTNSLLSLNSIKNAVGPNEYATKEREYKIRKVLDNDFENELFDDDISNLRRVTTFLQPLANCFTYILNEGNDPTEGLVSRIMSKYSPLYQEPFESVLSTAASLGMTVNQQNIKSLYNAFLVWDASRKQLIDMSPEYRDYLLYEYPIEFAKKIKDPKFATTKIPSLLIIGDMNNSTKIQSVNFLNAAPRDAKDDFTADLQDLLNTEDLEFFLDLIRYNIMRFGFIWQPKSMYANSPNIVRNLITNYDNLGNIVSMKTLFESPKDLDNLAEIELFLALYMRNNPETSQIPYIPFDVLKSSKDGSGYIKKGTDFTIGNKKYKTILISPDIVDDPSFDFSPQTTLLLRVGKELYQKMGLEGFDYRYIKVNRLGIQSNYMEYEYTEDGHPLESVCNTVKGILLKNRTEKIIKGQEEQTSDDNENTAKPEDILPYELRLSLQEKEREVFSNMAPIVEALSNSEFNFVRGLGRTTVGTKEKALERFNRLIYILNTTASTNNGEESLNIKEVINDLNNTIKKYKLC